jgi:DNA mismatch repair protein MutS
VKAGGQVYGIQLAPWGGVIQRARSACVEQASATIGSRWRRRLGADEQGTGEIQIGKATNAEPQLGLFASEAGLIFKEISDLDLDTMTPLDAMNTLHELKKKVSRS